ncbi:MAG: tetratricopeptide repeat protein [Drouetiella hepatica Uher 2000/2452]|uniref:non-specific serine/threonine protein kinase n=1 Tax=Drouetiella hepatica Uher 2000/2452 TaxID=904376 RepID=A0A951QDT6_9CYAN|nr:tetratricopeptide repeat protein [Drouetiella hepatica Uher 2000/2452]
MNRFRFSQQSSEPPEAPLGGRYQLIEKLGSGGFGQTFLAQDLHLPGNPRCVIKRLQPQITDAASLQTAKRLFDTEAEVLYQLGSHDQIPHLLAHFEHQQEFYLAQELIVGQTLIPELMAVQPWTEDQTIAFLRDLLGVLNFVHQQNVIHRDIKPANLVRRERDRKIVLIDFGAVKQVSTSLTHANGVSQTIAIGTQGYMPSEQLAGMPRFSSDIYAVGMVAIQTLTGMSPQSFRPDPQTHEIQWQHLAPQVSPALIAVLDRMIRYDFRARYPSAAVALAAIEQLIDGSAATHALDQTSFPIEKSVPPPSLDASTTLPWKNNLLPPPPNALSQAITQPLLAPDKPIESAPMKLKGWLSMLTTLGQGQTLRRVLVSIAALGVVATVIQVASSLQPIAQLPAQSPSPSASPSPDPVAQASALLAQADQLRSQSQFQQAIERYQQASALNPKLPEAHWGRCYSLNTLEKFTEAITACDAALKIKPTYAEAWWSKGYALDRQQQDPQALESYEQAIALKPDFAEAWSNKGTALLQLDRSTEAIAAFDQATRLKPNFAEAWSNRGAALWSLQRFDEAIVSVDRALQVQPDYKDALSLRQQMRQRLGR